MGTFLDWLNNSNLSGSTCNYKQSWVPELVKYIKANCCKSATFFVRNLQTTFELNMAAQLHVANYINVQNGAGYSQTCRPKTDLELNVGQPGWQILRLHSKHSIPTSSRSSCLDSERMPNLSSTRIEYQLYPYLICIQLL